MAGLSGLAAVIGPAQAQTQVRVASRSVYQGASPLTTPAAAPLMRDPVWVYDNWSAYAEGLPEFESKRLTEQLALSELQQVVRLKKWGVHFDYYMMNAFWFAPDGAYRQWRLPDWPNGPQGWIAACYENGLKPGLWFGTNSLWQINAAPAWRESLATRKGSEWPFESMSMYEGGFLSDFMSALQHWYDQGIRMFELDIANFDAATPAAREVDSPVEIRRKNKAAFAAALGAFRRKNPDVMLVAFNDFGGDIGSTAGPFPFKKPVDLNWLSVFDSLYSGDVRASDVPQANFWRSVDLYNDHMVRRFEQSGVPLERIDPFCTFSTTWFGYHREKQAWKGMLLLTLARGSWKKTIYGSLGLLTDEEARWFAKAQRMYAPLASMGRTKTFGGIPGEAQPYGFGSFDVGGSLYTVVNPAQEMREVALPLLSAAQPALGEGRILFRDSGFVPQLSADGVVLGPGQMVLVGFGRYASEAHDLGVQEDVRIPKRIEAIKATFVSTQAGKIETTLTAPKRGDLRVLFQQRTPEGEAFKNKQRGHIEVRQQGQAIPVVSDLAGKEKGFGDISWSAAEIRKSSFVAGQPMSISYLLDVEAPVMLDGRVYVVEY